MRTTHKTILMVLGLLLAGCGQPAPSLRFASDDSVPADDLFELARTANSDPLALDLLLRAELRAAMRSKDEATRDTRLNVAAAADALRQLTASRTETAAKYWLEEFRKFSEKSVLKIHSEPEDGR
jgi:hypothetical protein